MLNNFRSSVQKIVAYPSAIAGITVILFLIAVAVYTMITIPYNEAITLWRGGEEVWYQNPKFAQPAWINYFSKKKYAESFAVSTVNAEIEKTVVLGENGVSTIEMNHEFDFSSDVYPQDLILYFDSSFQEKQPFISIELLTPDERT